MKNLRTLLIVSLVAGITMPALAREGSFQKPAYDGPVNIPLPILQGGDDIANATVIASLPYANTGTTMGYTNDYDETCPYSGSTSPDVVYVFAPTYDVDATISLCGSFYDTKLYVYENVVTAGSPYACNDDYCAGYASQLDCVTFTAGNVYYIVVDGYAGDFGGYVLDIAPCLPCQGWEVTLRLHDSWGDGWNGAALMIGDQGYTFNSGSEAEGVICLDLCTSYAVSCTPGSYPEEVSWDIYFGETLLLSGVPGTTGELYYCPSVEAVDQPVAFELNQNVPNPFNPSTTISYSMTATGIASLKVYDLAGRAVATLVEGMVEAGSHSITFDANNLTSGVYFYTLEANGTVETKKMVLMK